MNLDRYLLFSWIEEDNVQKAYFRVRPLLTLEGDARAEALELWPGEGCLRIVPDRNELHSFKGRMRSLGNYCVVDLRGLPAEAGKIRTNKNFNPPSGELNQYILYSDTVRALPSHSFYQLVDGQLTDLNAACAAAITPCFYLRQGDTLYGPVHRDAPQPPAPAQEAAGTLFELACPDGVTRLILCMDDAPAPALPAQGRHARPAAEATQAPAPAAETAKEKPAEPAPAAPTAPEAPAAPEQPAAEVAPAQPADAPASAPATEKPEPEKPEPEQTTLPIGQRLEILDASKGFDETLDALNKPVSEHANLLNQRGSRVPKPQSIPAPRNAPQGGTHLVRTPLRTSTPQPKNRLQELATGQFIGSHGEYEPPTSALPRGVRMHDVVNPVEAACTALRQAWHTTDAHPQLMDCILSLDGFRTKLENRLCQSRGTTLMQKVLRDRLQDLEAERLTALCELDRARRDVDAYKAELLTGLKQRLEKETGDLTAARDNMQAHLDALKAEVNALQAQQETLLSRLQQLQQDTLPAEAARLLTDAQMLVPTMGTPLRMAPAAGVTLPAEELVARLQAICAASGCDVSRNQAIALLALLAISPRIGVVCPTVAPLATLSRNIAAALGWSGSFVHQVSPEQRPVVAARPEGSAPALLMTSLPNYAAIPGVSKVLLNRNVTGMVRNAAYDADPWPVVNVPALPYVDELPAAEDVTPVSAASLATLLETDAADQQTIRTVLDPVLRAAPPLSGAARRSMFRFVSVCAGLMEGGFAVAADWAILLWILPSIDRAGRHYSAVKATLDEFPLSQAAL